MERCPNCGAQVRSDARFCTTCGYRLSDATATAPPAAKTEPEQPGIVAAADSPAPTGQTGEVAAPPAASEQSDMVIAEAPVAGQAAAGTAASSGSWPSSWNSWPSGQEPAGAPSDATTDEPAIAAARRDEVVPGTEAETATDVPAAAAGAATSTDGDNDAILLGAADEAPVATGVAPAAGAPVATDARPAPGQDRLDHARSLVDQLRDLLPALAAAPAAGGDASPIADELAAARSADTADQVEAFAQLRETVNSARAQPRDIDTMLKLVGSLDTIAALQERYDRLGAAIDQAIAGLRDQQGGA